MFVNATLLYLHDKLQYHLKLLENLNFVGCIWSSEIYSGFAYKLHTYKQSVCKYSLKLAVQILLLKTLKITLPCRCYEIKSQANTHSGSKQIFVPKGVHLHGICEQLAKILNTNWKLFLG